MNILIYVTYPTNDEAKIVSKTLLEQKLVACANIFAPHETIYWWEGVIQEDSETAVLYKTTKENFDGVKDAILSAHSYSCPCVVALDIEQAHEAFGVWIKDMVL